MHPRGTDDLSLPKATVSKIISEILANDPGVTFSKESRDLLIDCCVEFITLVSSEANEIAEKEAKKTIACEHVTAALEHLDYKEYIPEILKVAQDHKTQLAVRKAKFTPQYKKLLTGKQNREKKQSKIEQSGLTEEELIRQQQELFRSATDKFNAGPSEGAA